MRNNFEFYRNTRAHQYAWLIPAVLILSLLSLDCSFSPEAIEPTIIVGRTMGTLYQVKIYEPSRLTDSRKNLVVASIDSILLEVNRQMSIYDPTSEISRFNRFEDTIWFPVSSATAKVINQALAVSELSGGAFDITVGPLVNLWGFGPENKVERIPSDREIAAARNNFGYQYLSTQLSPPAVKKQIPTLYCDLNAIAKGYGVDAVSELLDALGFSSYLVEIGGEVRAAGKNQYNLPWRVGIQTPDSDFGLTAEVLLEGTAMATSGDYQRYFEKDGIRYSHLIDPRTGRPIVHRLASVTVIDRTCLCADAIATAIDVLGPDDGYMLAEEHNLAVLLIIRDGDKFVTRMTPRFEGFIAATSPDTLTSAR